MKHQLSRSLSSLSLITLNFFILVISSLKFISSYDERFLNCSEPFNCGGVENLKYPFWGEDRAPYCGLPGYELQCLGNDVPIITITSQKYRVLKADAEAHKLTVARNDYWNDLCPSSLVNTSINTSLFEYPFNPGYLTLCYDCPVASMISLGFLGHSVCNKNGSFTDVYFKAGVYPSNIGCRSVVNIPILKTLPPELKIDKASVLKALHDGFELQWKVNDDQCQTCVESGGQCGSDFLGNKFTCFCPDQPYASECPTTPTPSGSSHKEWLKITLIITASLVVGSAMVFYFTRTKASQKLILTKEERKDSQDVEVMLRHYGEHAPKRYTYGEIKKMTSCFQEKLGEGGYGGVYKGKLQDGSLVAVKLLKNPNSEGTDFINEVASISGTNHVNIVTLLGYCYQGRKRALVYEFLPNGSLDKHIYSGQNQNSIAWETLLQIAVGIGRGLEYLHQGCRTRILHFDIKPHNILLDAKFCPKISDFGLAKSYVQTKSLMTMSGTRGTPGYIAPEVFCRVFGGASHKSDVYSFGMLVLDLVGCRKNSIAGSEKTGSELYFPHYIYKQFELKEDHELLGISNDEEKEIQKKLVIVSLWCIQTNPSSRPSISRALEMLEGDIELLQIPPIPSLSSPPKSHHQHDPSTNTATLELLLTNGSSE